MAVSRLATISLDSASRNVSDWRLNIPMRRGDPQYAALPTPSRGLPATIPLLPLPYRNDRLPGRRPFPVFIT